MLICSSTVTVYLLSKLPAFCFREELRCRELQESDDPDSQSRKFLSIFPPKTHEDLEDHQDWSLVPLFVSKTIRQGFRWHAEAVGSPKVS